MGVSPGTPGNTTPALGAGVAVSALAHPGLVYPRLIAHRGGGSAAPENTLAAIRAGHAAGFAGVEFDAMLSLDGTPFLIHDETLDRTTNGRGTVAAASDARLAGLDAGSWHSPAYGGEPLPTLDQALGLCRELGLWVNLEIKPSRGQEVKTGAAVARVASLAGWPALVLSSFSAAALEAARQVAPELPRAWLVHGVPGDWRASMARLDARALHCSEQGLSKERAVDILDRGFRLACYTVNDRRRLEELLSWGVSAVFTDRLDFAAEG